MQAKVGIHDSHKRHIGEMESLGDHLRAEKDVDAAFFKSSERLTVGLLARHGVGIHAGNAGFREDTFQCLLDFLRAGSRVSDFRIRAFRARLRRTTTMSANMTHQALGSAVVGQRNTAVGALTHMAACLADHGGGKTPAVQKKNRLFSLCDSPFHCLAQGTRENAALWIIPRGTAQICDPHDGHAFVIHPLVKTHELVFSRLGIVPTFEGWCCTSQENGRTFTLAA